MPGTRLGTSMGRTDDPIEESLSATFHSQGSRRSGKGHSWFTVTPPTVKPQGQAQVLFPSATLTLGIPVEGGVHDTANRQTHLGHLQARSRVSKCALGVWSLVIIVPDSENTEMIFFPTSYLFCSNDLPKS